MGFVSDWTDSAREILTSPTEFFEGEERRDGFGYPLKFAFLSLLIAGLFRGIETGIVSAAMGEGSSMSFVAVITSTVATPVGGLIGLAISAGLVHILVSLMGGEEAYSVTLSVLEYGSVISAVTAVLNVIPLVGGLAALLASLYGLYINAKGLENFQGLSFGKALVALLLPGVVLAAIVVGVLVTFVGAGALAGAM